MKVQQIDHIGINVVDLDAAKAFFLDLGFTVQGEMDVEGEWAVNVGRIIGLRNVRDKVVMLEVPGGGATLELVKFHTPVDEQGIKPSYANTLGIQHICLAVDDVEAVVAAVKKHGGELMGEIRNYENVYKLCYVRGPEGIILELAEKLG